MQHGIDHPIKDGMRNLARSVSSLETALIETVAARPPETSALQLQAALAATSVEMCHGGVRVGFVISGYERPSDCAELTPVLYADASDRLLELEIIRWDVAARISPQIESLVCYD